MKLLKLSLVLGIGTVVALVLCVQCVRTYFYTDDVLVPQQAEREAERQMGAIMMAARSAGIGNPHELGTVLEHAMESAGDRVLWMRVLDLEGHVLAQIGKPQGTPKVPKRWREHENLTRRQGDVFVAMLPFRMHRPGGYVIELGIPASVVAGALEGLRQNLIVGVIASIALLLALAVIGLRMSQYIRGRYLESELQLARRVQSDLQPKAQPVSPYVEFGASAVAADHVGGDFYDVFEMESGKIGIVLGDVSGKGVPAALLVSVLQGAIRSSTAVEHERACVQINRMLCERTACERFATLFWGVFDPVTNMLRYVNAGHAAPMLVRAGEVERLHEGGPVLGMLSGAHYVAGSVELDSSHMLVLYSDGVDEATNKNGEEFGEQRIKDLLSNSSADEVCQRIMNRVSKFAGTGAPSDDRTLLVVKFPEMRVAQVAA